MTIPNVEGFITEFFTAYQCDVKKAEDGILQVALTEQMDKALMNRPFYWHYIRSLGQKGEPMSLTLITSPEKRGHKGEWIDIGSPRLQQMFDYIIKNEKYVLLFEEVAATQSTALYPWLLANMKVSYKGRQKKEELISLGIQLINGKVIVNMMDELMKLSLKQQISNFCYTLSPIIHLSSGYKRLEKIVMEYINNQPKDWVREAEQLLNEEIALLKRFYKDDSDNELFKKEVYELRNRYTPEIKVETTNGGLVYLTDNFMKE